MLHVACCRQLAGCVAALDRGFGNELSPNSGTLSCCWGGYNAHRYPSSAQGVQSLERPTLPPGAVQQEAGQEAGSLVLPSGLLVDGAAVTALDVFGGKGVVHIIQRMLIPQQAAQLLQVPATSLQAPLNPSQLATGRPQTSSAVAARHAAGHVGAAGDAAGIVAGAVTAMLVLL